MRRELESRAGGDLVEVGNLAAERDIRSAEDTGSGSRLKVPIGRCSREPDPELDRPSQHRLSANATRSPVEEHAVHVELG